MITRRKLLIGFVLGTLSSAFGTRAQQSRLPRVGILSARSRSTPSNPDPNFDAFARGMRELGYIDGQNVILDWWFADDRYDRLPELAAGLVQAKPDVLVTHATPAVAALMRATQTIPIVMTSVSDPLGSGFTTSLSRPDKNVTGLSLLTVDLNPKRVELIKQLLPNLTRLAVLLNPGNSLHSEVLRSIEAVAHPRGIQVLPFRAGNRQEMELEFQRMQKEGVNAVIPQTDSVYYAQRRYMAQLAIKHKVATMVSSREYVRVGGLIGYGREGTAGYRRAASYVDKILKGAKPSDLPIEQPSVFECVINASTAKALGLKIPQELIVRADAVID